MPGGGRGSSQLRAVRGSANERSEPDLLLNHVVLRPLDAGRVARAVSREHEELELLALLVQLHQRLQHVLAIVDVEHLIDFGHLADEPMQHLLSRVARVHMRDEADPVRLVLLGRCCRGKRAHDNRYCPARRRRDPDPVVVLVE